MNKLLPSSLYLFKLHIYRQFAFTLIEMLVVIAIIAIISVVAVALYSNVQADARDGKRQAELESIANALEVNKTNSGYQPLFNTAFGGGVFPGGGLSQALDPQGYPYCLNGTAGVVNSALGGWAASPASCTTTVPVYTIIGNGIPGVAVPQWKICTRLENRGTPQAFCRTNVQ